MNKKRYNLKIRLKKDYKITTIRLCGYKKITYKHNNVTGELKTILIRDDGKKETVEYENVIEVEKEEV